MSEKLKNLDRATMSKNSTPETEPKEKSDKELISAESAPKSKTKLNKNYCELCKVQCSGNKNYASHQVGKKHLRKLRGEPELKVAKTQKKRTSIFKKNQLKIAVAEYVEPEPTNNIPNNSQQDPTTESVDSSKMNNYSYNRRTFFPDVRPPRNYFDPFRNRPHYPSGQYLNRFRWNAYPPPVNNNFFPNPNYRFQYPSNNYNNSFDQSYYQPPDPQYYANTQNVFPSEIQNIEPFYSNEPNPSECDRSDSWNEPKLSTSSHLTKDKKNDQSSKSVEKESKVAVICRESSKSFQAISPRIRGVNLKKKLRTRSLSTSSVHNNEPEKEPATQQTIKDWTNTLLEANDGQISRLIHPSNSKEEAAVSQLITNLSKSKRKDLSRLNLRSNSMCSSGTNDEDENDMGDQNWVELVSSESEVTSTNDILETNLNKQVLPKTENPETDIDFPSSQFTSNNIKLISNTSVTSSKSSSNRSNLISSEKTKGKVQSKTKKSSKKQKSCDKTGKQTKRKSGSLPPSVNKKHRLSDPGPETTANREKQQHLQVGSSAEAAKNVDKAFEKVVNIEMPKKHLVKSEIADPPPEIPPKVPTSSNSQSENGGFSMDTLINLFASGDAVAIKDEFNDPLIDAIQSMDPNVLMNVCSSGSVNISTTSDCQLQSKTTGITTMPPRADNITVNSNEQVSSKTASITTLPSRSVNINTMSHCKTSSKTTGITTIPTSAVNINTTSACQAPSKDTGIASMPSSNNRNSDKRVLGDLNAAAISTNNTTSSGSIDQVLPISTPVRNSNDSNLMPSSSCSPVPMRSSPISHEEAHQESLNRLNLLIPKSVVAGSHTTNIPNTTCSVLNPSLEDSGCASPASFGTSEYSFSEILDIEFMPKNKSQYTPHLKNLLTELQKLSSEEKTVKTNLAEARSKISEYQLLLAEWNHKKKQWEDDEEKLIKKRGEIIEMMQIAVKETNFSSEKATPTPSKIQSSSDSSETNKQKSRTRKKSKQSQKSFTEKRKNSPPSSDAEILVIPVKKEKPEVIVIEDDVLDPPKESKHVSDSNADESKSILNTKALNAHMTVVNSISVFDNYLYTSSNDSTAKRFKIKNPEETVTYMHASLNVTEVVVENVQNETLVFTSCSNRTLNVFLASNGTKIKTYYLKCAVMSICKGWGKFFAGLSDGVVNAYNWKYEQTEVLKSENPASRIATAHQGRLHVLIILTSNGNISVRDAETGLLIRYIIGFLKLPSWLTVYNDLAYLSSADKTLTILDIMTGRAEKKLYVSTHTTGLAVHEDFIFTISYSGYVNCYNKEKMSDKKLYYGAGRNALTCICVDHDWVFTGNRKGQVSVFQFVPSDGVICQFGQCCCTFGLIDDLEFHVENDHLMKKKILQRCNWGICKYAFQSDLTVKERMKHMHQHIHSKRPVSYL